MFLYFSSLFLLFTVYHQILEGLLVDGEVAIFCLLLLLFTGASFAVNLLFVVLKNGLEPTSLEFVELAVLV